MTPRELEEYRALRATIRERGSTRVWVFVAGLFGWSALALATAALATLPVATLLPLLVLAGVFEAVNSLHIGVERVGRYLQVFFEEETGWEHTAMAFGRSFPHSGPDPLFSVVFVGGIVLNFIPVLLAEPTTIEIVVVGGVHLAVLAWIFATRRASGHQRAIDLARFQRLKEEKGTGVVSSASNG